jgi:hypothetical protein
MTELASIPNGMLRVGKDDVGHSLNFGAEGEILLHRERLPATGKTIDNTRRLDEAQFFRLLPIEAVPKTLFRERLTEGEKIKIGRDPFSQRVASVTSIRVLPANLS